MERVRPEKEMKLALLDCGANDGTVMRQIVKHLPMTTNPVEADAWVMPVAYTPNFRFHNPSLKKPYILLDYLEFGWQWGTEGHCRENRLGMMPCDDYSNIRQFGHLDTDEWEKLDRFIRDHPPALTFKRELLQSQVTDTMLPCEWLCEEEIPEPMSKAGFDARPIEVLHAWGWSNPSRAILHAEIFRGMTTHGLTVISQFDHIGVKSLDGRCWVSVYTPWYARLPMATIYETQIRSKISVSLPGAGWKCFRHAQAPLGAVMALPWDELAWSYPWESGMNCVRLDDIFEPNNYFLRLRDHTTRPDLYNIYVEGQRNLANYQSRNYVNNYLLPAIERVL